MKKKLNKAMKEKVTAGQFFKVHGKVLKELYQQYKYRTIAIIILACVVMCGSFINLKFLEYTTNQVSEYNKGALTSGFIDILLNVGIFLLSLLIIQLLQSAFNIIREKYISHISFDVEKRIVNKLSLISYEYYEDYRLYEKMNMASQASGKYSDAVFAITEMAKILVMLVVYGFMLSKLNPIFIVVIFIAIVISAIISAKVTDKQLDYWRTHVSPEERREEYFRRVFSDRINHQNIQISRSFDFFYEKYCFYIKREKKNYLKLNLLSFFSEMATSILFIITFLLTVLMIGSGVAKGHYNIGYFSMSISLLTSLFTTIKQFAVLMMHGNWYVKILDAYYDIMQLENIGRSSEQNKDASITLKSLQYQYPQSSQYALNKIDAQFEMGEKIAVVGHNGSGKTTLVSIILNLLKNFSGEYYTNQIRLTAIFQNFGQYQMTVKENIEMGCNGNKLSEERIKEILKMVGLYDFIMDKPDGINTMLGQLEQGVELSKGQWQRLALGRLLANEEANVWILDEPTAYLDPLAEIEMYNYIFQLAGPRLVFFISHRLGFAKMADRIMVIEDGKIAEEGTHNVLMTQKGLYCKMFEAQQAWYK